MRRREFIAGLGAAGAAAWPMAAHVARAQQPDRMRRIGVLLGGTNPEGGTNSRGKGQPLRVHAGACGVGLDRRPQFADGCSLGRRQC
jgi:hypothetical protein